MKADTLTSGMLDLLAKHREITTQIKNLYKTKMCLENQIRNQQILDAVKPPGDDDTAQRERSMRGER